MGYGRGGRGHGRRGKLNRRGRRLRKYGIGRGGTIL